MRLPSSPRGLVCRSVAMGTLVLLNAFAGSLRGQASPEAETSPPGPRLTVVDRRIELVRLPFEVTRDHQACWLGWEVVYRLRLEGSSAIELGPSGVTAQLDGWVSNSRASGHEIPRRSSFALSGATDLSASADLIRDPDPSLCCRERAEVHLRLPDAEPRSSSSVTPTRRPSDRPVGRTIRLASFASEADRDPQVPSAAATPAKIEPGQPFEVRIRLEHQHFLHGPFEPLLGQRSLVLQLGNATLNDQLPLDRDRGPVHPPSLWVGLPADRLDPTTFRSAPDSLHLAAHVEGRNSFELPEQPVRAGSAMKLSFWYLVAPGSQADCRAELRQYRDAPRSYRVLGEGQRAEKLERTGRWTRVERLVRTEAEATTLKLRFVVDSPTGIGELWIDDLSLEPVDAADPRP